MEMIDQVFEGSKTFGRFRFGIRDVIDLVVIHQNWVNALMSLIPGDR